MVQGCLRFVRPFVVCDAIFVLIINLLHVLGCHLLGLSFCVWSCPTLVFFGAQVHIYVYGGCRLYLLGVLNSVALFLI